MKSWATQNYFGTRCTSIRMVCILTYARSTLCLPFLVLNKQQSKCNTKYSASLLSGSTSLSKSKSKSKSQALVTWPTSMLCNYVKTCFYNKTQKISREPHIICQAAVSKPLHLAKTCLTESQSRRACEGDPKGGTEVGRLAQPGQNVLLSGPDIQSRNAFR